MISLTGLKGFIRRPPKSVIYAPTSIEITPTSKKKYCSACWYFRYEQRSKTKILLLCEHPNRWKTIKVGNWYKSSEKRFQEAPYTANKNNDCEDFRFLIGGWPEKTKGFKDK